MIRLLVIGCIGLFVGCATHSGPPTKATELRDLNTSFAGAGLSLLTAWLGGRQSAALALTLAALVGNRLFIEPYGAWSTSPSA